ncbi:LysR family transcriptional regulator [Zavarzinia aquatilis]|uniref:LysR family transcriptional regulator n=1 Tax=Zavarzinia aquatilis TaxID=2211142 RepID=A0A317E262_9PROT|nr:LysR family transcriptional regulator [Zavarzinia aquatilis]PWR21177.1 LysR family transcriptional regulator [Zavarzinia aquatilis]
MDRLAAMAVFRRVVELGSFAGAARDLNLSNAATSKHVAALEAHLGAQLLHRTTRRLALTETGQAVYERCVRVLDDVGDLEAAVGQMEAQPRGRLRVNAPMSFGLSDLGPVLPRFLDRYPEITVDLVMNDRVVDLVEEGFDVGVRIRSELGDTSMIGRRIGGVLPVVCASPDYLARRGTPQVPEDLMHHDCLQYSLSATGDEWIFRNDSGEERRVRPKGRLTANNGDVLRSSAVGGLGIWRTPDFLAELDVAAGRLVPIDLGGFRLAGHSIYVIYPPGRHLSPKVRAFVDFLVETVGARCRSRGAP